MTKYAQSNKAFNYKVDFIVDGELVTPTSASITVLKNDGSATSVTDAALTINSDATSAVYTIGASDNQNTLPQTLRFITVKFVYNGVTYTVNDVYLLRDSLLIPVSPNDVRALVSMTSAELPDENIDLFFAYSQLDTDIDGNLDDLISNGSAFIPQIQKALAARAAFNSCQMIELMLYQSEQADNTLYKRFSKIDFAAMLARLESLYNDSIGLILEAETGIPTIFLAVTGTDPVTGAS